MTISVHWYRGVALTKPVGDVLLTLQQRWGDMAVPLDRGQSGYSSGWRIGAGRVYANLDRPDMGVMVELTGEACELLGGLEVARMAALLELRCSRLDLAHDHCPFTPAMVRDAWQAGDVRSRSKVPEGARPDRQWRTSRWVEDPSGDMFSMGSRASTQYGRCYDRRGFTRFELELKAEAARIAADELLVLLVTEPDQFGERALGWLRRFVDFVDVESSGHTSRRQLLPWWDEFVAGAAVARVTLAGVATRTVEQVRAWVEHQVGPSLAVVVAALGFGEVQRIARAGRGRWSSRHQAVLAGVPLVP